MQSANPRRWTALAVIALAQFMVIMDTSIIGVALPEIQRDLGFSPENLSWVFNAYVVALGGLLLLGGRLPTCSARSASSRSDGRSSRPHRWPQGWPTRPASRSQLEPRRAWVRR
jgi:hypothetical protein